MAFLVVCANPLLAASQGDQAIQRAAVEQVEAQDGGDPAGNGAFAGATGAVDGDDRDWDWHRKVRKGRRRPTP
jgi:hypothetical protein